MKAKLESSLENSIINLIATDYATIAGNKPRQMLAGDIVKLVSEEFKNPDRFEPGQALWLGVDVNDRPSYVKNAQKTILKPVVITVWSRENLDMRVEGYSNREIRERDE